MNTIDDKAIELVELYKKNIVLNTPVYIGAHELHEWDEMAKHAALICVSFSEEYAKYSEQKTELLKLKEKIQAL